MEDAVVISGVGGHFPECDNLQEYGEKLLQNMHLISDAERALQPRYTAESVEGPVPEESILTSGKMRFGNKFDNTFFGMHSRLAAATDAITRHVLESTLEAVLDAGYSPKDLHGTNTAVYMGYHSSESESIFIRESADGFGIMGLNAAMTANRVSYWLDLKGTSFTHNSQLVSSMQGLDMAFRALSRGECDRAVVGAASLSCLAELATHYVDIGWLSPNGSCRPFDKTANGNVRSEAVVVFLLERRSSAKRVYAEVVHTGCSLCAELSRTEIPNIERHVMAHQLNNFYNECRINPDLIEYLEADGWGVPAVDEAEIGALDDVIANKRTRPLLIGSVKGNIGQTEATSGLASICKIIIAMEKGTIPATINHVEAGPHLPAIKFGRMQVVTENRPFTDGYVAVNNLGLGGILGHVLLRPNHQAKITAPAAVIPAEGDVPKLLLVSGRTPDGLELAIGEAEKSAHDPNYVHLVHGAFSSHIFGHMYRGYSIYPKADEQQPTQVKFYTGQKRPVWFVYSGMGSQWAGMGTDLMRIPVFAAAVERCHAALVPLGLDLKNIITTKDHSMFDNILNSFVGIAAVQIGLTDVLHAVGIEPTGIIGHSVGELGCAYADGCITAEQMMLAAHARGQASNETELIRGMMAAVGMGYSAIKDMVPESIEVACHNSSTSCTLSGPTADLNAFVEELKGKGIFARAVNVSNIAYHSRYIRPAAPRLLELLQNVITEPKARSERWVSTSVKPDEHDLPKASHASAEYFTNNLLSSVYFEEGCARVDKDAVAIEIAPHGLLQAILKRSFDADTVNIAMTKRDMPGATMVLDSLGKMYMEGLQPQVANLYPPVETPVARGTAPVSALATWDHRESWPVAFLKALAEGGPRTELHLPLALSTEELAHLKDCTWNGHAVLSPATCLNLILIIANSFAEEGAPMIFENVTFNDPIAIPEEGSDEVYVLLQRGSGRFEVSVQGCVVATGRLTIVAAADRERSNLDHPPPTVPREERVPYDADIIYEELGRRGLQCQGPYRSLTQLQVGARAVLAAARHSEDRCMQLEAMLQVIMLQRSEGRHELHRPRRIQRIVIDPSRALPTGSEHGLHFDMSRGSIGMSCSTGHIDIHLVETRGVPLAPTFAPILVQRRDFVQYGGATKCDDLVQLSSLSLQVAANQTKVPVLVTTFGSSKVLQDALSLAADQHLPDLHVKLMGASSTDDGSALLVSSAMSLHHALTAVRRQRGLLLAELPPGFTTPPELQELLSVQHGRLRYALFKHVVDVDPNSEVVHVEGSELPMERLSLVQSAVVYVVFRGLPIHAIPTVLRNVMASPGGNRAHCLFVDDATAPVFSLDAAPYAAQLRLGLRASMLLRGQWGAVHRIHLANLKAGETGCERMARVHQLTMEGMQVQYLGVNPYNDDLEDKPTAVGLLDYAARQPDGQRVMGVCSSSAGPLQRDPVLVWPIPQGWSDEDAGTVPLAYATALYILKELLVVQSGEKVLVVGGSTAVGQAAITLLLGMGCRVVTTVRDQQERTELRARFPHPDFDALAGSVDQYTRLLRYRSGKRHCIDAVLSQGSAEVLKGVMEILSRFGRTAHLGADQTVMSEAVGLYTFMWSTSLYGVAWNWPLTVRADQKMRVRDSMYTAIKQGLVHPLPHSTASTQDLAETQKRVVEGAGKVVLAVKGEANNTSTLLDPSRSCLVMGGPAAKAVSVIEWMLSSGARDVSLSLAGRAVSSTWLTRRLTLMASHYGATVRTLPTSDIQQLVKAAGQTFPLGLVMAMEQPAARVRSLDTLTRAPGCILAVLAEQPSLQEHDELNEVVQCRREQGYPAVVASLGDLPAEVRVTPLHQVLRAASNPAAHNIEVHQITPNADIDVSERGSAALPNLLPNSVEALRRLGLSLTEKVTQRVIPSLIGGPPDRRNKEVPPVFLVGGMSDDASHELGPVAYYIMASTVVVTPPVGATTIEEAAEAVFSATVSTQRRGPYTVAGWGWGGCVALEAGRLLSQRQDCYVTVFLLDASPDALQAAVIPLQNQPNGLPTALLKYLLKLDRQTEEQVYRASDWGAQMQCALGGRDEVLEKALTCVLRRVQSLVNYKPAARGVLDIKVAVSMVSQNTYHLNSTILNEMSAMVRVHPLHAVDGSLDKKTAAKQVANVVSSGIHVGRSSMMNHRLIACLDVAF